MLEFNIDMLSNEARVFCLKYTYLKPVHDIYKKERSTYDQEMS